MAETRPTAGDRRILDELRRQMYDLQTKVAASFERILDENAEMKSRIRALEVQSDNRKAREAATPTWLFGVIAALVGLGSLIINLFVQFGSRAP